jgi:hypothetical protein
MLKQALSDELTPHAWKGVSSTVVSKHAIDPMQEIFNDGARSALMFVKDFIAGGPAPVLAEDSDGFQGYSNPCSITADANGTVMKFRLRAFSQSELSDRENHLKTLVAKRTSILPCATVTTKSQYVNMGSSLKAFPELVDWAQSALGFQKAGGGIQPIRGGTGVDPFISRGIPLANLGTRYFAPESEKEITSKQNIGEHTLWLCSLVQAVAGAR